MNKLLIILLTVLTLLCVISCTRVDDAVGDPSKETDISAVTDKSDESVTLQENTEAGDAVVTVIATPNETKDVRTVTLVLTAGTAVKEVEITQAQTNAIALVKESDVVGPAAADYALKVMTNVPYTVTTEADWITVASTKAYAEETTTLKVAAFETLDASRSAEITVAAQGLDPMVFTLTQEGPKSEVWTIDLSTVMNYVAKCTTFDATPDIPNNVSIALFDGNLLVCAGDGSSPVILDKATGEKKGTFTGWDPYTYYIKNDDAGNLILGNRIWGWNYFCLRYVEPGTTTPIPVTDYWNAYIGAGFSVRGNIKSDAVIAAPKENGTYNSNSIFTMSIKGGEVTYNESLPITGFQGLASWGDGWGGMWQNAPNNFPGFALLGPTLQNGALFSVYGENMLYHVNTGTNPATATLLSDQGVLDSNTATNAMDARLIGDATYVAITGGNFYASAPLIQVVNTTTKQVYNLQTVGKAVRRYSDILKRRWVGGI